MSCPFSYNSQLTHKTDQLSPSPPATNKHILTERFGCVLREILKNWWKWKRLRDVI